MKKLFILHFHILTNVKFLSCSANIPFLLLNQLLSKSFSNQIDGLFFRTLPDYKQRTPPIETSPKYLSFMGRYLKATPVKTSFSELFLRAQGENSPCFILENRPAHS